MLYIHGLCIQGAGGPTLLGLSVAFQFASGKKRSMYVCVHACVYTHTHTCTHTHICNSLHMLFPNSQSFPPLSHSLLAITNLCSISEKHIYCLIWFSHQPNDAGMVGIIYLHFIGEVQSYNVLQLRIYI